ALLRHALERLPEALRGHHAERLLHVEAALEALLRENLLRVGEARLVEEPALAVDVERERRARRGDEIRRRDVLARLIERSAVERRAEELGFAQEHARGEVGLHLLLHPPVVVEREQAPRGLLRVAPR